MKDVQIFKTGKVKITARVQKFKAAHGKPGSIFTGKHLIKLFLELVQVQHIASRIGLLFCGQYVRTPIGRLLLFGNINAKQFPA